MSAAMQGSLGVRPGGDAPVRRAAHVEESKQCCVIGESGRMHLLMC